MLQQLELQGIPSLFWKEIAPGPGVQLENKTRRKQLGYESFGCMIDPCKVT